MTTVMSQPATQPAQNGDMAAYPTPQHSLHGYPPETAPVPTHNFNTELLVPTDDDDDYDPHLYANRQRAWSLILPDDLSQYQWDMDPQNTLRCPHAERPSNEHASNERDDNDFPISSTTGPPHEMPTDSDAVTAHLTNYDVDYHDANDDGNQIPGDSMQPVSLFNTLKSTCPFKYINKHTGSGINFVGCPFIRSLGHDPTKLLAFHRYPSAFNVFRNSIRHHVDVLPTNVMSIFDTMEMLGSTSHPVDFPSRLQYSTEPGLDVMAVLPCTTWQDGETPDAFASTLFVTAAGLPGRAPVPARPVRRLLSSDDYEDIHCRCYRSSWFLDPRDFFSQFDADIASSLFATLLCPSDDTDFNKANGHAYTARERNLTVSEFIRQWYARHKLKGGPKFGEGFWSSISDQAAFVHDWVRPKKITRPANANTHEFDIQGIPWSTTLATRRGEARDLRDHTYKSYQNIASYVPAYPCEMSNDEEFYVPKTMYTEYKATMEHFQLRNLMSTTASNTVHYARDSKVYTVTPFYEDEHCIIDLSDPADSSPFDNYVKITTLKARHGVTIVGGFDGEYAYRGEITGHAVAEGFVTSSQGAGIVTHIDVVKNRTSDIPNAIIATNDSAIHILDCETETFIDRQLFASPINCTDTSPDGNMRVIVGDARSAWIIDSAGKPVRELAGHADFGFACAWSSNSLHVATANQDRTVNIWDVRMWRRITTIDSDVSCYRSLRYSPLGSGPSTLLMCEAADRVVLLNADDYYSRQVHDFFGEIGGADFTPDGGRIWVANMDPEFGGLIEYERNYGYMPYYYVGL